MANLLPNIPKKDDVEGKNSDNLHADDVDLHAEVTDDVQGEISNNVHAEKVTHDPLLQFCISSKLDKEELSLHCFKVISYTKIAVQTDDPQLVSNGLVFTMPNDVLEVYKQIRDVPDLVVVKPEAFAVVGKLKQEPSGMVGNTKPEPGQYLWAAFKVVVLVGSAYLAYLQVSKASKAVQTLVPVVKEAVETWASKGCPPIVVCSPRIGFIQWWKEGF